MIDFPPPAPPPIRDLFSWIGLVNLHVGDARHAELVVNMVGGNIISLLELMGMNTLFTNSFCVTLHLSHIYLNAPVINNTWLYYTESDDKFRGAY